MMGIKLATRLRLGLSHLREHKSIHSFEDTLNPLCNFGMDVESNPPPSFFFNVSRISTKNAPY